MEQTTEEPPDNLIKAALIIINILIYVWVGWAILKSHQQSDKIAPNSPEIRLNDKYYLIGGNSLKAIVPPVLIKPQVLGIMAGGIDYETSNLLNRIIECESNWRNVCNQKYGCKSGIGLAQLIPSSVKLCEEKLGKPIDPLNENENLECAIYLLTRTQQGAYHWGCPDCNFGSYWCWHKHYE